MAATVSSPSVALAHRRFTLEQYERLVEVGILHDDDRVELIEGNIVDMAPIGARHVYCVSDTDEFLKRAVPRNARVLVQSPIRLPTESEPQPDLVVVRRGIPRRILPEPSDVFFLVEVSDSSREYDRHIKLPLYAAARIPEVWLFDVVDDRLERHTDPSGQGYQRLDVIERGERLASTVLPSVVFEADGVLGPPEDAE